MRLILFAVLAMLASCSIFTTDTKPIVEAEQARGALWQRHSGAFETFVKASNLPADQKNAMLAGIQQDREAYAMLDAAVIDWCAAYGSLDAEEQIKLLWKKYGPKIFGSGGGS